MNRNFLPLRRFIQLVKPPINTRKYCSKVDEPIKFSTSLAAQRRAITPMVNPRYHLMPWYQPYVIIVSIASFLIYFCILREESDLDLEFTKTLYDRVEGMEKSQLILSYKYNKENGLSTEDIEKRLKEIEEQEQKLVK